MSSGGRSRVRFRIILFSRSWQTNWVVGRSVLEHWVANPVESVLLWNGVRLISNCTFWCSILNDMFVFCANRNWHVDNGLYVILVKHEIGAPVAAKCLIGRLRSAELFIELLFSARDETVCCPAVNLINDQQRRCGHNRRLGCQTHASQDFTPD